MPYGERCLAYNIKPLESFVYPFGFYVQTNDTERWILDVSRTNIVHTEKGNWLKIIPRFIAVDTCHWVCMQPEGKNLAGRHEIIKKNFYNECRFS